MSPQTAAADASPAELLEKTRTSLNRGELAEAAEALQAYIGLVSDREMPGAAWLERGRIAMALGRFPEARRFLARAAQDPAVLHAARYELGRALLAFGKPERAVTVLMALGRDSKVLIPWRAHALSAAGRCLAVLGRHRAAQQALEAASEFGVASAQLHADDGARLMVLGAHPEAQGQLVAGVQMDPSCTDALVLLSECLIASRQLHEAGEVVEFGLQNSPYCLPLHRLQGQVQEAMGDFEEAAQSYWIGVRISPRSHWAPDCLLSAARCQAYAGKEQDVVATLRELVREGTDRASVRVARAMLDAISDHGLEGGMTGVTGFPRVLARRGWPALNPIGALLRFHLDGDEAELRPTEQMLRGQASWQELHTFLASCPGLSTAVGFGDEASIWAALNAELPPVLALGRAAGDGWCVVTGISGALRAVTVWEPGQREPRLRPLAEVLPEWEESGRLMLLAHPPGRSEAVAEIPLGGKDQARRWLAALDARRDGLGDRAERELRELKAEPDASSMIRRSLAETALVDRRFDVAWQLLQGAKTPVEGGLRPRWWWRAAVKAAEGRSDPTTAYALCETALKQYPDDLLLMAAEGALLLRFGRRRRGQHQLLDVIEARPEMVQPRIDLARDYAAAGEYDAARHQIVAALELEPDCPSAAQLLAEIPDRE